jgi:hemolysin activation/secretion protein
VLHLTRLIWLLILTLLFPCFITSAEEGEEVATGFAIARFEIIGNTLLTSDEINIALEPYTGPGKTSRDVESARSILERHYHKQGYPTVLVNIPEQTVEDETVQLQVIESTIRRVRVTGNRYFTMQTILKKMPSFRSGEVLYLPKIKQELAEVNGNPDIKVAPVLIPGKTIGTIDVELKVKDKLPLHGSLEVNNRSTHDTTDLRLNATVRYDNLWQKEHSVSLQYQVSPEEPDEVSAFAASYVMPPIWNRDHILALYGVASDSNIAFGTGFQTVGKGFVVGLRNVIPLQSQKKYSHSVSIGLDYKDFDDTLSFEDGNDEIITPITYMPVSLGYNSKFGHSSGSIRFSLGLNAAFRNMVSMQEEFEVKRYNSKGNYTYLNYGLEFNQSLLKNILLLIKCDGQVSDQALPSNEQYVGGGLKNVRGYLESEAAGDDAIHGTVEISYKDLAQGVGLPDWIGFNPNIFYDVSALRLIDPLPGQNQPEVLQGAGAGLRGHLTKFLDYEVAWGMALVDTEKTESGEHRFYFVVKGQF